MTATPDRKRKLLFSMLRIRRVQERIESRYLEDNMKTPVHLCTGQEAIAAGVCAALREDDYIQSNHRSHGHYLAKGGDLNGLMAELHCKSTGCSGGYGGSMHVIDTSVGHLGTSAIVGGGIPIGTGLGLASKMLGQDRVSVIFFGDGAADEGVFYESANYAILKRLPVVFILENNKWAVCSPVANRQTHKNVFHKGVDQDAMMTRMIDGNDVMAVYATAVEAVDRARSGQGPSFIECDTYRIMGHAGCRQQDPKGYRECAEIEAWADKCPVASFREALFASGELDAATVAEWDKKIAREIDEAFEFAESSPLPTADDLHNHLFCE